MTTVLQTSLPKGPNTGLHWNGQVYAGVTRALAMLDGENRRFARDFMLGFESDVSGDIVALSNDATFNMGITASITIISPPSQAEAHHGAGMQIATGSIPVWSSDGIVVGLDLEYVTGIDGYVLGIQHMFHSLSFAASCFLTSVSCTLTETLQKAQSHSDYGAAR